MSDALELDRFKRDIAEHAITVIRNDGPNRHIRFSRPGTGCYHFDLVTWPGILCYTGDMGTFVFQRLTDMFEFFRTDREYRQRVGNEIPVNLSYWSEKLIAVDGSRHGGKAKEFSEEKFRRVINEYRVQWMRSAKESGSLDKAGRRELWEAVTDEVFGPLDDSGGERAMHAAYEFNHDPRENPRRPYGWHFDDLFEHDFTEYTHSFVWACRAISWGVHQYDAHMAAAEVPV